MKEWQPLVTGVVIAIGIVVATTIHSLGARYTLAEREGTVVVLDRFTGTISAAGIGVTLEFGEKSGEKKATTPAN